MVLGTAVHHSISAAVPPDEARSDSHLTPVWCSNSSALEFALIPLYGATSSPEPNTRSEHNQSILTSAATTRGFNWCETIRITDLGRQNISETKWLKESYQVHQKGRSDQGAGEKMITLQVRQERFAFSGREVSVMRETLIDFSLYI